MKSMKKGSPEKFLDALENKIQDLSSGTNCKGCDKIESASDDEDYELKLEEARSGFFNRGFDTNDPTIKRMIEDAAQELWFGRDEEYTIDDWFRDTEENYPEYFDEIEGCGSIESAEDISELDGMQEIIDDTIRAATEEIYGRHYMIDDVDMEYNSEYDSISTTVTLDEDHDSQIFDFAMPLDQLVLDPDGDSITDDADVIADDIDAELDEIEEGQLI